MTSYNHELCQALVTPAVGDFGLEGYCRTLGLDYDSDALRSALGRTVLDVGSGYEGFACEIQEICPEMQVISLNPQLIYEDVQKIAADIFACTDMPRRSVAGLIEKLPFKDETFDSVVSSWAFPLVHDERDNEPLAYESGYRQIARVLKPDGMAYVGPVYDACKNLEVIRNVPDIEAAFVPRENDVPMIALHIRKTR